MKEHPLRKYAIYSSLVLQMFFVVLAFHYIGKTIDKHWEIDGEWGMKVSSMIGVIFAMIYLVKRMNALQAKQNSE